MISQKKIFLKDYIAEQVLNYTKIIQIEKIQFNKIESDYLQKI